MAIALNLHYSRHITAQTTTSSTTKIQDVEVEMIAGCLKEERWAQKKLYETFYGRMMAVSLRYSNNGEDAKDILNEGFIKVFRNLHKYKVGTSLNGWIRRIVINTAIDFYRKEVRHRTEDIEHAYGASSKGEDAISRYSAKEIMAVIQKLPPSYRTVFNLYAIEGYSHREISEQLGVSESTSRSSLVKARKKLKTLLLSLYK